jgi:hypothetical protein
LFFKIRKCAKKRLKVNETAKKSTEHKKTETENQKYQKVKVKVKVKETFHSRNAQRRVSTADTHSKKK